MSMLTETDFALAAIALACQVAAIKAVCEVEAPRGGFLQEGVPTILFERHIFSRLTDGKFDAIAPDVSNKKPGGYKGNFAEHDRLQKAVELDRNAALQSASWGKFQILGMNYKQAGYASLQDFINAAFHSEQAQLYGFVNFIKADQRLLKAIRARDFTTFARIYNGPMYYKNHYDLKMAAAYGRLK